MLLLAGPGVLMGTGVLGTLLYYGLPYDWSYSFSLMTGAILSATDPVAVVALLKELGASKRLGHVIEGESLVNDGTAIVVFVLCRSIAAGEERTAADVTAFFVYVPSVSVVVGSLFALASIFWLTRVTGDALVEISITLFGCFLCFLTAEYEAKSSGVLSVVVLGLMLGALGRTHFTGAVELSLHHFWETLTFVANTALFILTGVIIADGIGRSTTGSTIMDSRTTWQDFGYAGLVYVYVLISRGVVVAVLLPLLRCFGYGMSLPDAAVIWWGGLRGAVSLALALTVVEEDKFTGHSRNLVLLQTGVVVVLTLSINGASSGWLLGLLGLIPKNQSTGRALRNARARMRDASMALYVSGLQSDDIMGNADFRAVKAMLPLLNDDTNHEEEDTRTDVPHASDPEAPPEDSSRVLLEEARTRFLNILKHHYWIMLEECRCSAEVAEALLDSVDVALDNAGPESEGLMDWQQLWEHSLLAQARSEASTEDGNARLTSCRLPSWMTYVLAQIGVASLASALDGINAKQRLALITAVRFYEAHEHARQEFEHARGDGTTFIPESEADLKVAEESRAETEKAAAYIRQVRTNEPEVASSVKSEDMALLLLAEAEHAYNNLSHEGGLTETELQVLREDLQRWRKRIRRFAPRVAELNPKALLRALPLMDITHGAHIRSKASRAALVSHAGSMFHCIPAGKDIRTHLDAPPHSLILLARGVVDITWSIPGSSGKSRVGSTSTPCGWAVGAIDVLLSSAARSDITMSIISVGQVAAFVVPEETTKVILETEHRSVDALWGACFGLMSRTIMREDLSGVSSADIRTASISGKLERKPVNATIAPPKHEREIVVLMDGTVHSHTIGTIQAPALLHPDPYVTLNTEMASKFGNGNVRFGASGVVRAKSNPSFVASEAADDGSWEVKEDATVLRYAPKAKQAGKIDVVEATSRLFSGDSTTSATVELRKFWTALRNNLTPIVERTDAMRLRRLGSATESPRVPQRRSAYSVFAEALNRQSSLDLAKTGSLPAEASPEHLEGVNLHHSHTAADVIHDLPASSSADARPPPARSLDEQMLRKELGRCDDLEPAVDAEAMEVEVRAGSLPTGEHVNGVDLHHSHTAADVIHALPASASADARPSPARSLDEQMLRKELGHIAPDERL